MNELKLPARYEAIAPLGQGGGGEVFQVKDRKDGRMLALKALFEEASAHEAEALVREAIALSGLEGLGLPRVFHFGRLPETKRPYLVRELVPGRSLAEMFAKRAPLLECLGAIAHAADTITTLHRAGLLHGDIKPANIIVGPDGSATLVDLGLSIAFRERAMSPSGMTPRYAAPELLRGEPLSVRAEIHSLGATLAEALEIEDASVSKSARAKLLAIVERAKAKEPSARFPSADELANELRRVAKLDAPRARGAADAWPVVGIDSVAKKLLAAISALKAGEALLLQGPPGSGRTALFRRAAWSLGIAGHEVAWADFAGQSGFVFVDDADDLDEAALCQLRDARTRGQKFVLVAEKATFFEPQPNIFPIPPLDGEAARMLMTRAIPSLSEALVAHALLRTEARPGPLRALVRKLEGKALITTADLDAIFESSAESPPGSSPLSLATRFLDQGRFDDAAIELAKIPNDSSLNAAIARARLALGQGDIDAALKALEASEARAKEQSKSREGRLWQICKARAHLRKGEYSTCAKLAEAALKSGALPEIEAEALAVMALAKSYTDEHEEATRLLERAIELARSARGHRIESLALASLALVFQRREKPGEAREAYERALEAAERAEDAGAIATIRLNLAVLAQGQGDIAQTIAHWEAAIDMGQRAGRRATVQQARINLANLDIHLGRYARARASVEALASERESLSEGAKAQLLGLEAFLASRTGAHSEAADLFGTCGEAYEALGRGLDAAEAWLEGILVAVRESSPDSDALESRLTASIQALGESNAHRVLLALAKAEIARLGGDEPNARASFDEALEIAKAAGKRDWIVRALEGRAQFALESGRIVAGRRDSEQALLILEEIAAELPRDLREVYWDDPSRKRLRNESLSTSTASFLPSPQSTDRTQDDRLARILEINRKLAGVHDLDRLVERITDHAVALLEAEHGFVLLIDDKGELIIQASRGRDGEDARTRFSRSIAERVISSGEPVVSLSAQDDERLKGYASVHQMMLKSVACAPIRSPKGDAIGALYLETRIRPGAEFSKELPTLSALADQVAIAIENARLVTESAARAKELAETNQKLLAATQKLEELLGQRTAQLDRTQRDLKTTREALESRFGYGGIVGQSEAMRKVYALIDRIKDTDVPVLLTGESGTGKEVVARAIHDRGPRAKKPFVGVNCGAIPEHLLESELFGHIRGAFTGADRDRKGLFREGEGGTILLDEIGEMPQKMQAGLLRVLQEKRVRPVGGPRELAVDVRVIAATHRDLEEMVGEQRFREDLFYRLNVVEVRLPALRERADDIPLLIDHFLGLFAVRFGREKRNLSREAIRLLSGYMWPGNIRQLENALLNAWITSEGPELGPEDFDLPDLNRKPRKAKEAETMTPANLASHRQSEKERILRALEHSNWNRVKASEMLGMPRRTFYRRLKEYGIQ